MSTSAQALSSAEDAEFSRFGTPILRSYHLWLEANALLDGDPPGNVAESVHSWIDFLAARILALPVAGPADFAAKLGWAQISGSSSFTRR